MKEGPPPDGKARGASSPSGGALPPITIVRVIDRLNVGGPAIHAVLTTAGLDPTRFRTVLVVGSIEPTEGDMGYLLEQHGVTGVVQLPALGREMRPLRDLTAAWQLLRVLLRERPLVVHTHKAKAGALGRLLAFATGVPVRVHTFHGHVLDGYFGPLKSAVFRTIERLLAAVTHELVVPSAKLADDLSTQFGLAPRGRFHVVPLGFDLVPFANAEQHKGTLRARLGVAPGTKLVGIVGRMVPVKDHATFVSAAQILAARRPEVAFVFVGGGELESQIRADVAARGLGSRAHFLGWQRELAPIYADLDAVVLSSINEGTPVSLIEAMAAGRPVAATAVGGVADVFRRGERGELAPPRDPDALATAIDRALRPEALARAQAVRAAVIEEYGRARLCRDLEELYLRLLTEQGRLPAAAASPRGI